MQRPAGPLVRGVRALAAAALGPRPTVACVEWLEPLYNAGHWVPEMVAISGGVEVMGAAGAFSTGLPDAALADANPVSSCTHLDPRSRPKKRATNKHLSTQP